MIGPLSVVMICSRSGFSPESNETITSGSAADSAKNAETGQERAVDVAGMFVDGGVDAVDEPVGQPQRVPLGQALPGPNSL